MENSTPLAMIALTLLREYWWAAVISFFVLRAVKRRYFHTLSDVPGSFLGSISRLGKVAEVFSGCTEKTQLELHRKYGPIIRIAPNEVSISDPAAIPIIYDAAQRFIKTDWYAIFGFPTPKDKNLFSEIDPEAHRAMKRNVASTFSMSTSVSFEPYVSSTVKLFMQRMEERAAAGLPVNLVQWFQWYAFDVIGELSFSRRFGFLDEQKDVGGTCKMLDDFIAYTSAVANIPWSHDLLLNNPLLKLVITPPASIIADMAATEINARTGEKLGRSDITSKFFETHERHPDRFTKNEIFRQLAVNVSAGSETTGITLDAIAYFLMKHPKVYARLQAEIDAADEAGKLSEVPTFAETNHEAMPYLAAVIKEVFRVHPPVSLTLPRVVPKGGATICGRFFPEGTRVGLSAYVVHRDRRVFGNDADVFRPERWIDCTKERYFEMDAAMLQFSAGARACVGRHIAMMEMCKLFPTLLRKYSIELVEPEKEWFIKNYTFLKPREIMVWLKPRDQLNTVHEIKLDPVEE